MKAKIKITALLIVLSGFLWLLSRPCSIRPFQNKSCYKCGVEEGEKMAIEDWNKTHAKEWQVDNNGKFK